MQEHFKCKHIKSLNMVNMVKQHNSKRNFVKKGLVSKHKEVDISKIVTTVNVTLVTWTVSD